LKKLENYSLVYLCAYDVTYRTTVLWTTVKYNNGQLCQIKFILRAKIRLGVN